MLSKDSIISRCNYQDKMEDYSMVWHADTGNIQGEHGAGYNPMPVHRIGNM